MPFLVNYWWRHTDGTAAGERREEGRGEGILNDHFVGQLLRDWSDSVPVLTRQWIQSIRHQQSPRQSVCLLALRAGDSDRGLVEDPGDGECPTAERGRQRRAGQTRLKVLHARPYSQLTARGLVESTVNKDKCVVHQGELEEDSLNYNFSREWSW